MNKDKNKKDKHNRDEKYANKNDNHNRVLSVIRSLGSEAILKNVFPELLKKLTQEEIILALNKLDRDGVIRIRPKGIIEVVKKEPQERKSDKGHATRDTGKRGEN